MAFQDVGQNSDQSDTLDSIPYDECLDILCKICGNAKNKIIGYCYECDINLCSSCLKNHRQYERTKEHTLSNTCKMFEQVGQDTMQDKVEQLEQVIDDSKKNRDMFAEKCDQHAMEYLQYFCSACNSVCCHICSHESHKGCDSVEFIPNIVEGYDETNEFRDFYQKIGYLQFVLEKDKEKNKENVKTLQNSSTDALKALKAQRRDINRIFDQLEQAVKSENLAKSDGRIDKLQELAEENKNLCLMLRNLKRDLNQKANHGYTCQMFVGVKKSKDELEKMKVDIEKLVRKSKVSRYVYVPDSEILCQVKTMQHLGSIKETKPAQVLHPYSTVTEKGEVNLHVGAVINVIEEVNAEWWTGEHKGQSFQFPANYVIKTQVEERKKAKVLYPYVAKPGKDELNLLQGDIISVIRQDSDGWWEGVYILDHKSSMLHI